MKRGLSRQRRERSVQCARDYAFLVLLPVGWSCIGLPRTEWLVVAWIVRGPLPSRETRDRFILRLTATSRKPPLEASPPRVPPAPGSLARAAHLAIWRPGVASLASSTGSSEFRETSIHHPSKKLTSIGDTEFSVDPPQIGVYCVLRDSELARYRLLALVLVNALHDFQLSRREG